MFPIIHLGFLTFQARGFVLLVAFWIALTLSERVARRHGFQRGKVENLGFYALLAYFVGARLGYVLQYSQVYVTDLPAMFALNFSTLSPVTGILLSLAFCVWYIRRHHFPLRKVLDICTPGFIVLAAGIAIADLATGDGYGAAARLPWSIQLWGELRHPTQVYDVIAAAIIGAVIWRFRPSFDGARFGLFVSLYAVSRLYLEAFHGDSATLYGFRVIQLWSLLIFITTILVLRNWASKINGEGVGAATRF